MGSPAAQVRLLPFDEDRLFRMGQSVRNLYPTEQTSRIQAKVSDAFLQSPVAQVTTGFGGTVPTVPQRLDG
ncbi:MAG TPA: BREX system ATP-binding domain-containing protein [Kofleriaceae bacterium]|jgi:hypothetical protein|nr:BREX system ATP-binding domain-containing protein [Kofleriaceae bacterium]